MKAVQLSVIIPIYNVQDYIGDLISDIQKQTFTNFEVLLIDDGSIDQSASICKKYIMADRRFYYHYQKNRGVSAARNYGIERANGEYIVFLDADDRIPKECFWKRIYPLQMNSGVDLVIGRYQVIGNYKENKELFWQSDLSGQQTYEDMLFDCIQEVISFYYGVVWNKVYRKDIIIENRIRFNESLRWCEDFIFNMKYFRYVKKCYYLSDSTYYYYLRPDSTLSKNEIIDDRLDFMRYHYLNSLGEVIQDESVRILYHKKVALFLIHRLHGILSEWAKKWRLSDRNKYREWKSYLCADESYAVWNEKGIYLCLSVAEKIVWILMKIKGYCLIYVYYIIKAHIRMK